MSRVHARRIRCCCCLAVVFTLPVVAVAQQTGVRAERWQAAYAGEDVSGSHVIGHWKFESASVAEDAGPLGLKGQLDGARAVAAGRFGGGLECFAGWPVEDRHHALVVASHPALSPDSAFSVEMWVRAKADLATAGAVFLLDKKYASQNDYQWKLGPPDPAGLRQMNVILGYGSDSESYVSERIEVSADGWQHLAFTYDGQGTVRFYRDGSSVGVVSREGRRGVAAGSHALSIGDRVGSYYGGFPGYLDEVRLCRGVREFSPVALQLQANRTAWRRFEGGAAVQVRVQNLLDRALEGTRLTLSGLSVEAETIELEAIESGGAVVVERSFDTRLRPGPYEVRARLVVPADPPVEVLQTLRLDLVPRPLAGRMPVMMWGIGSPEGFDQELSRLQRLGFTHCLGFSGEVGNVWEAGEPVPNGSPERIASVRRMLDRALLNHMGIAASIYAGAYLKTRPELQRVDRSGQPYARQDCNAALPGLREFCENVGISVARTHGDHPAFEAALINSEVRDASQVSFSDFDREAYRKFAGRDIPAEVQIKNGVLWTELPGFPADRVIPDDHPVLQYYRWFWTVGDGWNGLHTAIHRGLKSTGRHDLWTWYDPSIRVPSIGGSGGEVDVLSQWTYTEPSPLRVGYFCDEVFAMARESAQQPRVMKMTQLFWYRSSSAPLKSGKDFIPSPFDDHDPDAAYISIAPMHLRGAFWSKIARPVAGLMYHGWSSLVPTDGTHAYKYTQPDLQTEFERLHREVLPPLGPMLLELEDRPSDVAYLNSFTAQMFARRGSYGYSHDEAYLTLLHAQLQPRVIFEETLLARGLDSFRVLVLVDCDVLTRSVVDRILAFQQRGGIVIGDPNLAPAIRPDFVIPRYRRTKRTDEDKNAILANAARLREMLDGRYQRHAECSHPEIVTRVRQSGEAEYVFVVNDAREFGSYVGQHGLVMEHGVPAAGQMTLRRPGGYVYDVISGQAVAAESEDGAIHWPVRLGPCDGRIFVVTPRRLERVQIVAAESGRRGDAVEIAVSIEDGVGQTVPAAIPVEVRITDPNGREGEGSGFHVAVDGRLRMQLDLAVNDTPGVWQVAVRELASRREMVHDLRVEP